MVKRVEDEEVIRVLSRVMKIPKNKIKKDLKLGSIPEWDSVGHMVLMSKLEEKFDIMLDMDDIIDFSGFERGKEILLKYDVKI